MVVSLRVGDLLATPKLGNFPAKNPRPTPQLGEDL